VGQPNGTLRVSFSRWYFYDHKMHLRASFRVLLKFWHNGVADKSLFHEVCSVCNVLFQRCCCYVMKRDICIVYHPAEKMFQCMLNLHNKPITVQHTYIHTSMYVCINDDHK